MNKAVVIFLKRELLADTPCTRGVRLKGGTLNVTPLSAPATRVVVSNVPPFIKNDSIVTELARFGKFTDPMTDLPLSCKDSTVRHVLSFRRQVYMFLNREQTLDVNFKCRHGNSSYTVFATTERLRCFGCGEIGHKRLSCPRRAAQPGSSGGDTAGVQQRGDSQQGDTREQVPRAEGGNDTARSQQGEISEEHTTEVITAPSDSIGTHARTSTNVNTRAHTNDNHDTRAHTSNDTDTTKRSRSEPYIAANGGEGNPTQLQTKNQKGKNVVHNNSKPEITGEKMEKVGNPSKQNQRNDGMLQDSGSESGEGSTGDDSLANMEEERVSTAQPCVFNRPEQPVELYTAEQINRFLKLTKGKHNVLLTNYFLDKRAFIKTAQHTMGVLSPRRRYRLRKWAAVAREELYCMQNVFGVY